MIVAGSHAAAPKSELLCMRFSTVTWRCVCTGIWTWWSTNSTCNVKCHQQSNGLSTCVCVLFPQATVLSMLACFNNPPSVNLFTSKKYLHKNASGLVKASTSHCTRAACSTSTVRGTLVTIGTCTCFCTGTWRISSCQPQVRVVPLILHAGCWVFQP